MPNPQSPAAPRVLMLSDVYFPRINGVSTSIETFRRDLAARGVATHLVAPAYGTQNASADDADVVRIRARRVPFDPEDRLMHFRALRRAVDRLIEHGDYDLIHVQTPFAAHYVGTRAARRHGLPVMATYHTHFEEYIHHYLPLLPRRVLRAVARHIARTQCNGLDAVVVPSGAMADTLRGYGVTAPLHVLPTGIPVAHFTGGDRARFRARHGIDAQRPVALFVGRVAHEKNIDFLLRALPYALRRQPDLLLVIAGEGPALRALRHQAEASGLAQHVLFVGYLDRERELPDCYAAADVFVFASRTETQGLVLLEAMAAGLPVVALAVLGTRDIVLPARGAIAAPDDEAAFGAEVAALTADPARRALLSAQAREFAECWSSPERARQLEALYRSVSAHHRAV
jgi:glycosyltransferase involved in cell wall biosynthesis